MSESRRLPARVYWVRRLVVLGIPLLIVAVVRVARRRARLGRRPDARRADARPPRPPDPSRARRRPTTPAVADCAAAGAGPGDDTGRRVVRGRGERHVHGLDHQHRRRALPGRRGRGPARDRHHLRLRPGVVQPRLHRRRHGEARPPAPRRRQRHHPVRVEPRPLGRGLPAGTARARRRHVLGAAHPRRDRAPRPRCSDWARARRTARGCSTRRAGTVPRARPARAARRRRRRP